MRAVVSAFGADDDVAMAMEIGAELSARGHDVLCVTNSLYEATAAKFGLACRAFGDGEALRAALESPELTASIKGTRFVWREVVMPWIEPIYRACAAAVREHRPDVIVCSAMDFGALWAAESSGAAVVTIAPQPEVFRRGLGANQAGTSLVTGAFVAWLARQAMSYVVRRKLDPSLREVRAQIGLPVSERDELFYRHETQAAMALGMWSPLLRPHGKGDPEILLVCGFMNERIGVLRSESPEDAASWMEAGEPPIVATVGGLETPGSRGTLRLIAKAAKRAGRRLLIAHGRGPAPKVEYGYETATLWMKPLIERCSMLIGKPDSLAMRDALVMGKPILCIPPMHSSAIAFGREIVEQGIVMATAKSLNDRAMAGLIERVMTDPALERRRMAAAARFAEEHGPAAAAEAIEGVFAR